MTSRRDFLRNGAVLGGALLASHSSMAQAAERFMDEARSNRVAPMNMLIFGGTGYIGPHLVRQAVARGHKVTIFSRGRRDADIPASVARLVGDRTVNDSTKSNLTAIEGKHFDAVLDDFPSDPRMVQESVDRLKTSGSYMFVSSTGVYLPYRTENADETAPALLTPEDGSPPQYGNNKARCEKIVMDTFGPDRGQVVRPAYIIGPGDTSDRFGWWPQRLAKGGETAVLGRQTDRIAIVDVRDLAAFMVKLAEDRRGGIYNVTGPKENTTLGEFMPRAKAAMNSTSELVWIDDYEFLRENRAPGQVVPWTRLDGNNLYHTVLSNKKAVAAGLTFRPFEETIKDFWAWWPERLKLLANGAQPRFQFSEEREKALLTAWKAKKG